MIYIERDLFPLPEFFNSKIFFKKKEELHDFYNKDLKQTRFKFDVSSINKIKKDLKKLFKNKCAYCESEMGPTSFGAIEHFRPKGSAMNTDGTHSDGYWWLAYEWRNLYLACDVCNRHKRNKFPVKGKRATYQGLPLNEERYLLIDPCNESDIQAANFYYDESGSIYSKSERGLITIDILALNRPELKDRRQSILKMLRFEMESIIASSNSISEMELEGWELRVKYADFDYQSLIAYFVNEWISDFSPEHFLDNSFSPTENKGTPKERASNKSLESYTSIPSDINRNTDFYNLSKIIKKIEIKNFKSIKELCIDYPNSYDEQESWMIIIGENGVGKSSILQAISLALSGQSYLNQHKINWQHCIRKSRGVNRAQVKVYFIGYDEPIVLTITKDKAVLIPEEPQLLVLAYGSTRLLPKESNLPHSKEFQSNINNLFDQYSRLKNVESWLSNVNKVSPDNFNLISSALKQLLLLPNNTINDGEVKFRRQNGRITLNYGFGAQRIYELCDGYKSVLAYVLDIMMSIYMLWPSPEDAEGLVLIDEIENHLHPTWKIKIISQLRNIFPLLNFVVTTHDPLCLRGAKEGEVRLVTQTNEGEVKMESIDIPPGLPIENLLMGVWFKMESTLDENTLELLNRHSNLVLSKAAVDINEISEIERTLKQRMSYSEGVGLFGSYLKTLHEVLNDSENDLAEDEVAYKISEKLKRKFGSGSHA